MALTRDFKQTVVDRVEGEPAFAQALLDEAATLFLNSAPETARLILRDLINAAIGFEQLATLTAKPGKSLHRVLSSAGNSNTDNLEDREFKRCFSAPWPDFVRQRRPAGQR